MNLSLEKLKNIKIKLFFQIQELLYAAICECRVPQKLRHSSVIYYKSRTQSGAKICMNSSFKLFLCIMKVEFQEYQ